MKKLKISFKVLSVEYESGILEKEFRNFIKELDHHAEFFDFKVVELKQKVKSE